MLFSSFEPDCFTRVKFIGWASLRQPFIAIRNPANRPRYGPAPWLSEAKMRLAVQDQRPKKEGGDGFRRGLGFKWYLSYLSKSPPLGPLRNPDHATKLFVTFCRCITAVDSWEAGWYEQM